MLRAACLLLHPSNVQISGYIRIYSEEDFLLTAELDFIKEEQFYYLIINVKKTNETGGNCGKTDDCSVSCNELMRIRLPHCVKVKNVRLSSDSLLQSPGDRLIRATLYLMDSLIIAEESPYEEEKRIEASDNLTIACR